VERTYGRRLVDRDDDRDAAVLGARDRAGRVADPQERGESRPDALQILERRLAEGDITVEEYRERRAALTGPPTG
jgi:uncharacterized membrane protein